MIMKTCKKCGLDYPDSENFCTECGSRLEKISIPAPDEGHEDIRKDIEKLLTKTAAMEKRFQERHEDVASSSSAGLSRLAGKLGALEKRVYKQPMPAASGELASMAASVGELEKRMGRLEDSIPEVEVPEGLEARIATLEKQVRRAGKEAMRVAKAKHMPDRDKMGIVSDIGELEGRIDRLEALAGKAPEASGLHRMAMERRISSLDRKIASMGSGLKSFVNIIKDNEGTIASLRSELQTFAKHSDMAGLRKALAAEDEKTALKLSELASARKEAEKAISRIEKAAKQGPKPGSIRIEEWLRKAGSEFATKEQVDGLLVDVDARVAEKLKPLESFREKVMVIAGLALEQQEKFKELKSSTLGMVSRRLEQTESAVSKQLEQMKTKADSSAAAGSAAADAIKAKTEGDIASLSESLSRVEEFENRLSGELEALKESAAHMHDIEALKELMESCNARLSTFKQMLASQAKATDELSQLKAQMESEQERSLDEMNSRISEAVQEIKAQGNSIVADMERKMNESLTAGLKSIDETRARMDGEMKLVLDTLARSQGFDKAVDSELASLKSEMGRIDSRIKAAVAGEKGALDEAIAKELKRLQKTSKDAEQRLAVLKDSWDKVIKETVRKNVDEFEKLRKVYSESLEKLKDMDISVKSVADRVMKDVEKRLGEEGRANAALKKEFESALKEMRMTNRDSQEKLSMVKEFISNLESRLGADVEGLERRVDKLSKIQQRMELEELSPRRKVRQG